MENDGSGGLGGEFVDEFADRSESVAIRRLDLDGCDVVARGDFAFGNEKINFHAVGYAVFTGVAVII